MGQRSFDSIPKLIPYFFDYISSQIQNNKIMHLRRGRFYVNVDVKNDVGGDANVW